MVTTLVRRVDIPLPLSLLTDGKGPSGSALSPLQVGGAGKQTINYYFDFCGKAKSEWNFVLLLYTPCSDCSH